MSFSLFAKCLTWVSVVGVASVSPAFYSAWKTSNLQSLVDSKASGEVGEKGGTKVQVAGISQERLRKDKQHDDCVNQNVKFTIKSKTGEQKKVTLSEFSKQYSDWDIISDADYTLQCSRELSE